LAVEPPTRLARLHQIHSAEVVVARDGACGRADALVSSEAGLALSVVTADCVPLLMHARGAIAAVHAGWRGIAAGVVGRAVEALEERRAVPGTASAFAWIGPAIGACCYEVGHEVAARVAAASDASVIHTGPNERPHLDLAAAVAAQLRRVGIDEIRIIDACTRCHPEWLWSYRRHGSRAGRNHAFIWR
jgi:YfiH family protein